MRISALLILLLIIGVGSTSANQPESNFKLYLVRHAEKQTDEGNDPGLTDAGKFRAYQLTEWFQYKDIKSIWSTDYKRTRDTVIPLVHTLNLQINLYDPRDLPALANQLLENRSNALIAGHSNTTPELTRLLCQCDVSDMDDSEYDLLFVVSVFGSETKLEVLMQSSLSERREGKE